MRHKKAILFGAALAAMPVAASNAATITYNYYNILFGTSPTTVTSAAGVISGTSVTGNGTAEVVTVPAGDYVSFGIQADVTNNGGSGLVAFDLGISDSNATAAGVYSAVQTAGTLLTSTKIPSGVYNTSTFKGDYDGAGGVQGTPAGAIAGVVHSTAATNAQSVNGANTPATAFSALVVAAKAGGTSKFTPIQNNGATSFFTENTLGGTNPTATASYSSRIFNTGGVTDVLSPMPTLTITVPGVVTSGHPIVALSNTTPTLYGSQLGATLNMVGGHSGYLPAFTGLITPPAATGYAAAANFNPVTDTEVYALQLNYSGGVVSPSNTTLIAAIISDINNGTGAGTAASNVSASTITGAYASLFPTYDILLTSTGGFQAGAGGVADLGIDFSQDTDAATPGLVVTEVAAVPEPATAAGIVLGAAGLLLGRRKSKVLA